MIKVIFFGEDSFFLTPEGQPFGPFPEPKDGFTIQTAHNLIKKMQKPEFVKVDLEPEAEAGVEDPINYALEVRRSGEYVLIKAWWTWDSLGRRVPKLAAFRYREFTLLDLVKSGSELKEIFRDVFGDGALRGLRGLYASDVRRLLAWDILYAEAIIKRLREERTLLPEAEYSRWWVAAVGVLTVIAWAYW